MIYNVALIPGDGIGPEIIKCAVAVLNKIGEKYSHEFVFQEVDAGGVAIDKYNDPLPKESIDACLNNDSVLLGAVGGPKWDHLDVEIRPEKGLLKLRSGLNLFTNLRPAVLHNSLKESCVLKSEIGDKGIDIMVIRELTGGIYFGERGRELTTLGESAWDTERYSYEEIKRIAKVAFETAMKRRKKLVSVDKANVLESSRLWREVVIEVSSRYPEVALEHMYVDNAAMQLIKDPSQFDVIVTSNMFGDILSDEASQITGSIGMLPSASLGKSNIGLYEPIHGSAPDIADKDLANPIATILSAAMMLKYSFGLEDESNEIEKDVTAVLDEGFRTPDIFTNGTKKVGTKEMGNLICSKII